MLGRIHPDVYESRVMPKLARELKAVEVRRISTKGLNSAGGVAGFHLQVQSSGAVSWILRARSGVSGRRSAWELIQRSIAREMRAVIREGCDQVMKRAEARIKLIASQAKLTSFRNAAITRRGIKRQEIRNTKCSKQ